MKVWWCRQHLVTQPKDVTLQMPDACWFGIARADRSGQIRPPCRMVEALLVIPDNVQ